MSRRITFAFMAYALLAATGVVIANSYQAAGVGKIAVIGSLVFLLAALLLLRLAVQHVSQKIAVFHSGLQGMLRYVLLIIGYIVILLATLSLLGISVGNLIIGGAALGIILGVAAQQALANLFASIVLIMARPFSVGSYITVNSGALGRKYTGYVEDIGFVHTTVKMRDGTPVLLPNAALLAGATITKRRVPSKTKKGDT